MEILSEICKKNSKWRSLEVRISCIKTYPDNGPRIADNCKCIIESICKTILEDIDTSEEEPKLKIHQLAKLTLEKLGCINKMPDLVSAFTNVIQKFAEFRNKYTETAHGQSVNAMKEKEISNLTISFLVTTTEQVAIYLIHVYQDEYPQHIQSQLRYEDHTEFNQNFDKENEMIEIGEYGPYKPSEILFCIEENAYKTALEKHNQE